MLSVLGRKRKCLDRNKLLYEHINERNQTDVPPPHKKQKAISVNPHDCETELELVFSHHEDQLQFISLYKSIQSTQMINTLRIPTCIIQTLAEYATGILEDCDNEECTNKIVRLYQDIANNDVKDKYYRCNKYEYYFCTQCIQHTERCECGEWKVINRYTSATCAICNFQMTSCTDFCGSKQSMISQCYECQETICYYCHNYCPLCQNSVCGECIDKDQLKSKYDVLYSCDYCDNKIHKQHSNCRKGAICEDYLKTLEFKLCDDPFCHRFVCNKCDADHSFCDAHQML